jgi:hypothetical protein
MRRARHFLVALLAALAFPAASFAGPVNLQFITVGGASIGGEYVYPYYFYIDGSTTLTPMICDTYDRSIGFGESWTANAVSLTSGQGFWNQQGTATIQSYEAAAIIFSWLLNGTTVAGQQVTAATGNLAIWGLFDGGRGNSGWTAYEQTLINTAFGLTHSQSSAFYSQFTIYVPTDTQVNGPQEFIGYNNGGLPPQSVPEPASLAIVASGLIAFRGVVRKRRT